MQRKNVRAVMAAVCLWVTSAGIAADLIPVEDFARRPTLMSPRLSPDGLHLAVRMDDADGNMHGLVIYAVDDMSAPVSILRMPRYELPVQISWVSPTRLVVSKGKQMGSIDEPRLTGEIIATDVDGKHQDYLFGFEPYGNRAGTRALDRGWGTIDGLPERANGHFYMGAELWNTEGVSELYDIDAQTSARRLIGDIGVSNMNFMVDKDGKVRFAYGGDDDFKDVIYRRDGANWSKLDHAVVGYTFSPLSETPDRQGIYAFYSEHGGPDTLIEQDTQGGARKVLARDDFSNVSNLQWTAVPMQPFAAMTATGIPTPIYVDKNLPAAKLHQALSAKFPGSVVDFIDFSEDGKQLLFSVSSDRSPGMYLLIDTTTFKVRKLFDIAPWIDAKKMAERRPIRFKTDDGRELDGYLTLPPGRGETGLPMVLLPHGGPHYVRDDWYYDDDAQFLASRGYLVLQVNYRGSSGRGKSFLQAGFLKWGTRIQQDLIDGVKWAIAQNYADPKRVCVYGGSFGGYSAMMATVRAPDMFKCAVGYAGIYDLDMMYNKGDVKDRKSGRSYLTAVIGKDEADLAANSPDHLAAQIDVPVLLVHGEDDERAPFAQAKAMRAALDAAHKPYEWLAVSGEGHGFYKKENVITFYNRLQAFLEKNIGPGAPAK
jgi:dienelactone hydrolase